MYKNSFAESARMMNYSKDHKANVTAINNISSHYYMAEAKDKSTLYYQKVQKTCSFLQKEIFGHTCGIVN